MDMIAEGRKVIVIYGGGSGSGKTTLAVSLLKRLIGWAAIKITPSPLYASVSLETGATGDPGKDTARLRAAGADPVLHVRAGGEDLPQSLEQALALVPSDRSLIIEGRGALECLKKDLSVFVWRPGLTEVKGRPDDLWAGADLLVVNREASAAITGDPEITFDGPVIRRELREPFDPDQEPELAALLKGRGIP